MQEKRVCFFVNTMYINSIAVFIQPRFNYTKHVLKILYIIQICRYQSYFWGSAKKFNIKSTIYEIQKDTQQIIYAF